MTIISTTVGKNPLEEMEQPSVNKSPKCSIWVVSKMTEWIYFQCKSFNITVIQGYASTANAKKVKVEWFYEDLQDLLELTPKKEMFFSS